MSRNKTKVVNPFYEPAARDAFEYVLRQITKLKEQRKRDKNNIGHLKDIVSLKVRVRPFEEEPEEVK